MSNREADSGTLAQRKPMLPYPVCPKVGIVYLFVLLFVAWQMLHCQNSCMIGKNTSTHRFVTTIVYIQQGVVATK